ncbi:MAG TPA: type II toxin-antitoxin system VapC family toxin [Desulfuromonadales bacterium]|nr:type II toxin-antitoxin system VapC family toxin [Desulfuromonadales bacterium]
MNVVVDTSIIIAVLLNEPQKSFLIEVTSEAALYAPASLHWEVGNAFSAMFKQKRLTLDQAQKALRIYSQIPLNLVEVDLGKSVHVSLDQGIYAYDAYFVVCAQKLHAPLLTLDKGLKEAAKKAGIRILEVA